MLSRVAFIASTALFVAAPSTPRAAMLDLKSVFDCGVDSGECVWDRYGTDFTNALGGLLHGDAWVAANNPILNATVLASRGFAGPDQYPPSEFAAYGLIAFRSKASSNDFDRHVMICEAFTSTFRSFGKLQIPRSQQMITIWPVDDNLLADRLNSAEDGQASICPAAVSSYDFSYSEKSIQLLLNADSEKCRLNEPDVGPYLIAWSPTIDISDPDVPALCVDLSEVHGYTDALRIFVGWKREIQDDPSQWILEIEEDTVGLRQKIAEWFDDNADILVIFK